MTGYLTSVLTIALGWVRGVASSIWQLLGGSEGNGFWAFISDHWKGILIAVCAAGLLIDLAVYLLRWRPDRVWVSFFRRVRRGAEDRRAYRELMAQPDTTAVPQLASYAGEPEPGETETYDAEAVTLDPPYEPETPLGIPEDPTIDTVIVAQPRRRRRSERS